MLKTRFSAIVLLSYVVAATAAAGDRLPIGPSLLHAGKLTACVYTGFEAVLYRTPHGLAGSDITLLEGFAQSEGLDLDYREVPFDGIWLRPGHNECDIAAAGIGTTVGRDSPGVAWSDAYYSVRRSLLIRASDASRFASFADFSGRRIGFVAGSSAQFDLEARHWPKTIQVGYKTVERGIDDLLAGRIDAFAAGNVSTAFIAERQPELRTLDINREGEMEVFAFPTRATSGIVGRLNDYIETTLKGGPL